MSYDQAQPLGDASPREEPDFRAGNGLSATYQPGDQPTDTQLPPVHRPPVPSELDHVFDDDGDEEAGADRMTVHLVWELVLLLAVGAAGFLLLSRHSDQVTGANRIDLLVSAAALGLLTMGVGLSTRAGAPNLAVGPLAVAAGIFFATRSGGQTVATVGMTLLAAASVGAVIAVLVVGLQVPGWAASLGAGFALVAWIRQYDAAVPVGNDLEPGDNAYFLAGGVFALALVGALIGAVPPIRRAIGRFRPYGDPAWRRGAAAAGLTFLALTVSGVFAGAAGVLLAAQAHEARPGDGLAFSALALGAVLLGGTSAFGRRGGILGSVLAVALLTLVLRYSAAGKLGLSEYTVGGVAVLVGLVATRLVERFGRPAEAPVAAEPAESPVPWQPSGAEEDTWTGGLGGSQWGSR
jgi:ribose/xylose/arabinose/galactoside ABC-type transport system permease subunit